MALPQPPLDRSTQQRKNVIRVTLRHDMGVIHFLESWYPSESEAPMKCVRIFLSKGNRRTADKCTTLPFLSAIKSFWWYRIQGTFIRPIKTRNNKRFFQFSSVICIVLCRNKNVFRFGFVDLFEAVRSHILFIWTGRYFIYLPESKKLFKLLGLHQLWGIRVWMYQSTVFYFVVKRADLFATVSIGRINTETAESQTINRNAARSDSLPRRTSRNNHLPTKWWNQSCGL